MGLVSTVLSVFKKDDDLPSRVRQLDREISEAGREGDTARQQELLKERDALSDRIRQDSAAKVEPTPQEKAQSEDKSKSVTFTGPKQESSGDTRQQSASQSLAKQEADRLKSPEGAKNESDTSKGNQISQKSSSSDGRNKGSVESSTATKKEAPASARSEPELSASERLSKAEADRLQSENVARAAERKEWEKTQEPVRNYEKDVGAYERRASQYQKNVDSLNADIAAWERAYAGVIQDGVFTGDQQTYENYVYRAERLRARAEALSGEATFLSKEYDRLSGVGADIRRIEANRLKVGAIEARDLKAELEATSIRIGDGSWMSRADYAALSSDEKKVVRKDGIAGLQRYQRVQQQNAATELREFKAEHVQVGPEREWITKADYDALPKGAKDLIKTMGVSAGVAEFNRRQVAGSRALTDAETREQQREEKAERAKWIAEHVRVGDPKDDAWVSRTEFKALPEDDQRVLKTKGVAGYESWVKDTYETLPDGYRVLRADFDELPEDAQKSAKQQGVRGLENWYSQAIGATASATKTGPIEKARQQFSDAMAKGTKTQQQKAFENLRNAITKTAREEKRDLTEAERAVVFGQTAEEAQDWLWALGSQVGLTTIGRIGASAGIAAARGAVFSGVASGTARLSPKVVSSINRILARAYGPARVLKGKAARIAPKAAPVIRNEARGVVKTVIESPIKASPAEIKAARATLNARLEAIRELTRRLEQQAAQQARTRGLQLAREASGEVSLITSTGARLTSREVAAVMGAAGVALLAELSTVGKQQVATQAQLKVVESQAAAQVKGAAKLAPKTATAPKAMTMPKVVTMPRTFTKQTTVQKPVTTTQQQVKPIAVPKTVPSTKVKVITGTAVLTGTGTASLPTTAPKIGTQAQIETAAKVATGTKTATRTTTTTKTTTTKPTDTTTTTRTTTKPPETPKVPTTPRPPDPGRGGRPFPPKVAGPRYKVMGKELPPNEYPRVVTWAQGVVNRFLDLDSGKSWSTRREREWKASPWRSFKVISTDRTPPKKQRIEMGVVDVLVTESAIDRYEPNRRFTDRTFKRSPFRRSFRR